MLKFADFHLYTGLSERVVVLDTIQKFGHAPEGISFDHVQDIFRNIVDVVGFHVFLCRSKRIKENVAWALISSFSILGLSPIYSVIDDK